MLALSKEWNLWQEALNFLPDILLSRTTRHSICRRCMRERRPCHNGGFAGALHARMPVYVTAAGFSAAAERISSKIQSHNVKSSASPSSIVKLWRKGGERKRVSAARYWGGGLEVFAESLGIRLKLLCWDWCIETCVDICVLWFWAQVRERDLVTWCVFKGCRKLLLVSSDKPWILKVALQLRYLFGKA